MANPLTFTIFTEPTAKGRARATWVNGKAHTYTPEKTRDAETDIKCQIINSGIQGFAQGVPLKLEAIFYRTRPKSLPKRVILPVSKPDATNYLKGLEDAMEDLLYPNDSQITTVVAKKRYGYPPRVEVKLSEDDGG